MSNVVLDGVMGLAVADALGLPVEFEDRDTLREDPVMGMRSYGTYNQPAGTWSDDTSMTLSLLESLTKTLDYKDIMDKFIDWFERGKYTPHGEPFDIGNTTRESLARYKKGVPPLKCGGSKEGDNGNGSLMRILPLVFYLKSLYKGDFQEKEEIFTIIHNISSLTHRHKRSLIACGIYLSIAWKLLEGEDLEGAIGLGIYEAIDYYGSLDGFKAELKHFLKLEDKNFKNLEEKEIKTSGYVVDTLEAAIWSLLNTSDYKTCVLKAVNLGNDTDTVGAVAGGLAGISYGYKTIPSQWKETLVRRQYIEDLSNNFYMSLKDRSPRI